MSANKSSSIALLGLCVAVASLLGVFAIMDASTANASLGEFSPPAIQLGPGLLISPTQLHAELPPDELISQTLWITNTGDTTLTFSIYEMTTTLRLASEAQPTTLTATNIEPEAAPSVDPELPSQIAAKGNSLAIIFLRGQADLSAAYGIADRTTRIQVRLQPAWQTCC